MKRYLISGAAGVALAGLAIGAYFYLANQPSVSVAPQETATSTIPTSGTITAPQAIDGSTNATVGTEKPVAVSQPKKVSARLVQISKGPVVAGAAAYQASSTDPASDIAVNFIERQSGNVFQYLVKAGSLTRTSNKTIPGIQEASWLPNGSISYARYLSGDAGSTINTYALPRDGVGGYFLAQNIVNLSVSATNILALASGSNGSVATLSKPDGSSSKQAFITPLSSLRTSFLGSAQYLAYTKPSATLSGFAYLVNATGNFERIAGPLSGLAALASPKGKWVLLSYTSGGILKLGLYSVAAHTFLSLPVGTLIDKCVWSNDDVSVYCGVPIDPPANFAYPDDWYQGAISFTDRIWRIDVDGRYAELTLDFTKEAKQNLDATALSVDLKDTVLVFKNKNDGSLWSYEL